MYISRLEICIFRLNLYISKLEMKLITGMVRLFEPCRVFFMAESFLKKAVTARSYSLFFISLPPDYEKIFTDISIDDDGPVGSVLVARPSAHEHDGAGRHHA